MALTSGSDVVTSYASNHVPAVILRTTMIFAATVK